MRRVKENDFIVPPSSSQNNWYLFNDNGNLMKSSINRVCYGSLAHAGVPKSSWFVGTCRKYTDSAGHPALNDQQKAEYLSYLFFESQFADIFQYNDVDWCLANNGVILPTDIPSPLVIFLAQYHRLAYGYTSSARSFLFLREHMDPAVALYVCNWWHTRNDEVNLKNIYYLSPRDEHYPMDDRYGCRKHLENFLSGQLDGTDWKPFKQNFYYKGISKLWHRTQTGGFSPDPQTLDTDARLNPFLRPVIKRGKKVNPIIRWAELNKIEDIITWKK